ncbi:type IV pilus secretin PilQ [Gallibacterium anatis]|uniref:type IV pilus secretin PilQ n=1 Tax=Gallibacterium anatis TaxID=750 RepID=UPI0022318BCB|nr:type IV pilus secretin PilQ [Gallibacterium anatis]UZD15327.1 type IV pilus secretin PilQ [Gallibacterium anatis]
MKKGIILVVCMMMSLSGWSKKVILDPFFTEEANIMPDLIEDKNLAPTDEFEAIAVKYIQVNELYKIFNENGNGLLSGLSGFSVEPSNNLLLVKGDKQQIQKFKQLISQLDKPGKQIAIEARIVTINNESLNELGVRWGMFSDADNFHKVAAKFDSFGLENLSSHLNVNFSTSSEAASIALQVAKIHGRLLDLELKALEQENNVEIIASPHLLTSNQRKASIKQGSEIPYVIEDDTERSSRTHIEFKEAVLGLEVTPQVLHQGVISLDLVVTQNSAGASIPYGAGQVVTIDKQEVQSQVLVRDGETVVLGGIFHDLIGKGENKVPLLGDIPGLGKLFSSKLERHQKRELVIFITPRIIHNSQETIENYQKRKQDFMKSF